MKLSTRLRLWWNKLYIRHDEFHKSLDLNIEALLDMTSEEQLVYKQDLLNRRITAHNRDIEREDNTENSTIYGR